MGYRLHSRQKTYSIGLYATAGMARSRSPTRGARTRRYQTIRSTSACGCLALNSAVEGLYKKHGPLALIGSRTKLMQHWADRIDHWLDPKKVTPIEGGAQG
jgi:hypothetical protein